MRLIVRMHHRVFGVSGCFNLVRSGVFLEDLQLCDYDMNLLRLISVLLCIPCLVMRERIRSEE